VHGINDMQELSMTHKVVSKGGTEVLHRIRTHHLPLYFPNAERFLNSTRREWFLAFLGRFPVPASVTALGKAASSPSSSSTWPGITGADLRQGVHRDHRHDGPRGLRAHRKRCRLPALR
jgi:hypothetical protein